MASIIALVSGMLMAVQGVWNTRIREGAGMWFTNVIVHGVGFAFSLLVLLFVRDADLTGLKSVNKIYLLSGVLGAGIVYTVVAAISKLGPACATMLILIAQIISSYLIQLFGLFGQEKTPFEWTKALGIAAMIIGIIIFRWERQ